MDHHPHRSTIAASTTAVSTARATTTAAFGIAGRRPISRRRLLGLGGGLAAGVGFAPVLSACSADDATTTAAVSSSGGTLTMGINATPDTLDPGATGLALTLLISFALFDPLVYWLPDGNGGSAFHPGLAESWTISPDASVYTFKLRKGVTFHDGTPFNAAAVKATYDHVVDPRTKSKSGLGALGPYRETKVLDDYTVQIVFTEPNASFLHQQAAGNFGISSPAALTKYGPTGFGNHPVGTGPFTFESYQTGSQLTLLKNPKYTWGPKALGDGPAKLDKLVFRIVTDDSGRYNALQSGQLQIAMNLPPNNISAAQKSGRYQQLLVPSIGTPLGMPINVAKAPTDDPLVRQAILSAVDQDAMVKSVLYDVYKPAHNVLTPITPGYSEAASKIYSYDPDKAAALLDRAGWSVGDGGTRTKNGQKLTLDIILFSGGGLELPTQFIVSQLQKVGFSATTSVQPFATAQASFNSGVHNLGSFGYYGADPYLLNIWVNSNAIESGFNWSHYNNPAIDTMIARANATAAEAARNNVYQQVGTKLMQDSMYLPLWDVAGAFTLSPKVRNLHQTLNGYLAFHSATVG